MNTKGHLTILLDAGSTDEIVLRLSKNQLFNGTQSAQQTDDDNQKGSTGYDDNDPLAIMS